MYGTPLGAADGAERARRVLALPALGQLCRRTSPRAVQRRRPVQGCCSLLDKGQRYHLRDELGRRWQGSSACTMPRPSGTQPDSRVFHDADALTYNYTVEGPGHQVIVTDTRSWRSFPKHSATVAGTADAGPDPETDREHTRYERPRVAGGVIDKRSADTGHPDRDAKWTTWRTFSKTCPTSTRRGRCGSPAFDRLIKAISQKMPRRCGMSTAARRCCCPATCTSASSSRLLFTGTSRFEDVPGKLTPCEGGHRAACGQLVQEADRLHHRLPPPRLRLGRRRQERTHPARTCRRTSPGGTSYRARR